MVLLGRFFGSVSTSLSACLLFAPLMAWIFEVPRLRDWATVAGHWATGLCRIPPDRRRDCCPVEFHHSVKRAKAHCQVAVFRRVNDDSRPL